MRFAVKTAPQLTTWPAMLDVWQAADDVELFESAWTFDHFEPILGSPATRTASRDGRRVAAMAQATRRIRVGVMVTGMPYRHPAVLANMAATVDVISGGRLELGLGAGWNTDEASAYGIDIGSTLTERFDRFDEGCEVILGLLTRAQSRRSRASTTGLTEAFCEPKAVQTPAPARHDRWRRRAAHVAFRGPVRPAMEHPLHRRADAAAQARGAGRALRRRRTRPRRDRHHRAGSLLDARVRPRRRAPSWPTPASISPSSRCRPTSTSPRSSSRWRRRLRPLT